MLTGLILGIFVFSLMVVGAIPNPASTYCIEMGYQNVDGNCIFTDGNKCAEWDFLNGVCGKIYVHNVSCAQAGKTMGIAKKCCMGLIPLRNVVSCENGIEGIQVGGYAVCSDCGNKICESWENECNCVADCKEKNTNPNTNPSIQNKTCAGVNESYTNELTCCPGLKADKDTNTCIMEGKKVGWFRNMANWFGKWFKRR